MNKDTIITAPLTDEEAEALKAKHKVARLYEMEVKREDGEPRYWYFKDLDRTTFLYVMQMLQNKDNSFRAFDVIIENAIVAGGQPENSDLMSLGQQYLEASVKPREATLKKR